MQVLGWFAGLVPVNVHTGFLGLSKYVAVSLVIIVLASGYNKIISLISASIVPNVDRGSAPHHISRVTILKPHCIFLPKFVNPNSLTAYDITYSPRDSGMKTKTNSYC